MKNFILLFAIFILTGCLQDRSFGIFTKDKIYQEAIKHTQKGDIINAMDTKAILIATYLNPIYNEFKERESFYIGVYVNDEFSNNNSALEEIEYTISLNGLEPISIEKRADDDKFKKDLAFTNDWFKYYIVEFNKFNKDDDLNLTFNYHKFGETTLKFIK